MNKQIFVAEFYPSKAIVTSQCHCTWTKFFKMIKKYCQMSGEKANIYCCQKGVFDDEHPNYIRTCGSIILTYAEYEKKLFIRLKKELALIHDGSIFAQELNENKRLYEILTYKHYTKKNLIYYYYR